MGILNVTPDSFSDGGLYVCVPQAVDAALQMLADGADLIDIGGESTRPGSAGVPPDQQIARTVPVIRAILHRAPDATLSIDTTSSEVAQAAIDAGVALVNDTSAGTDDPQMLTTVRRTQRPIVLMHRRGTPPTMQQNPHYDDVLSEVTAELSGRVRRATDAGIAAQDILIDVGIGFGKTTGHNLTLLRHHLHFKTLGHAMLLGASRKRFVGEITGVESPGERLAGSLTCAIWGALHGADILRVHDVAPTVQALRMLSAIQAP